MFGQTLEIPVRDYTIKVIEAVRMTSRPLIIIYYALCYILYTIYSKMFTIYYRLYSLYMVYLYTIAGPLKLGDQVLASGHVGARP